MLTNIVLPQTRGNDASVKDLIISILGKEWPLSTSKIYNRIVQVYAVSCSYQAVHKSIKKLLKDRVLLEKEREYYLNTAWLDQIKKFSEETKEEYSSKNFANDIAEDSPLFHAQYLDNYRDRLRESIKPIVKSLPVLYCVKSELDNSGLRNAVSRKRKIVDIPFKSRENFILLGPSGSGKTTATFQIAYAYCKISGKIPILFNLTNFNGQSLPDIVQHKIFEVSGERINTVFIQEALEKGSFIFLFDGLNEVFGDTIVKGEKIDKASFAIDKLNQICFSPKYRRNKFIIACRANSDPKDKLHLSAYALQPLTEKQMRSYLEEVGVPTLFEELNYNPELFQLCTNPLMLDMTINVYNAAKSLPKNKTSLYGTYFTNLLYGWESKSIKHPELIALDLEESLSKLGLRTIQSGTIFSVDLFLKTMREISREIGLDRKEETRLIDVSLRSNLIHLEGTRCKFGHHSFQEFFAAKELFQQFEGGKKIDSEKIKQLARRKNFLEPLTFLSGLLDDSTEFLKAVLEENLFAAGECLITAKKTEETTFKMLVRRLIKTVGEKDLNRVWYAVDLINRIGPPATNLVIQEIEQGNDPDLKRRMYWVAGGIPDDTLNQYLVDHIKMEKDAHSIDHFLLGLQEKASKERVHIAKVFLNHPDPIVQGDAFIALRNHELPAKQALKKEKFNLQAVQRKLMQNLDSTEFWSKMHSILLLGKLQSRGAVDSLIGLLTDENQSIQWYSALALSQIGDPKIPLILKQKIENNTENTSVFKKTLEAFENGVKDRKTLAKIWIP